ncbi:TadE/TadG family type IV pilus assembly protein [Campylobacter sp. MG1]|uniref:TadE/TadG family type IV pilus assembly protein n=1 Tax=Campylobacter sp. MG1 TaxID=2976332 RepID=UPI00226CF509|nr:hypothetical protein [Campylobacter sp. MG1]
MTKFILEKQGFALISVAIILPFIFALCVIAYDLSMTLKNHSRLQDALREASFLSATNEENLEDRVKILVSEYLGSDKNVSNIQIKQIDGITKVTADITNNGIFNKFISADDISISTKGIYGMQPSSKISDTDYIFAISFGKSGAENSTLLNSTLKNLCNEDNKKLIKYGVCNPPLGKAEIIDATQTMIANIIKTAKEYDSQNKQYFGFVPYSNVVMVNGKDLDEKTIVDRNDGLTKSEYENAYYYIDPMDIYVPNEFKKVDLFSRFYPKSILNHANSKFETLVLNRLKALDIDTKIFTNEFAGDFLLRKFALDLNNERLQNYSKKDIEDAIKTFDLGYDNQKPGLNEGEFKKDKTRIENTINNAFDENESMILRLYNHKVDKLLINATNDEIIQIARIMQIEEGKYQSYLEALSIAKNILTNNVNVDNNSKDDFNKVYALKIYDIYYNKYIKGDDDEWDGYTELENCGKVDINGYTLFEDYNDNITNNELDKAKDNFIKAIDYIKQSLKECSNLSMPKLYDTKKDFINDVKRIYEYIADNWEDEYEDYYYALEDAIDGKEGKVFEESKKAKINFANIEEFKTIIAPTYPEEAPKLTIGGILPEKIKELTKEVRELQRKFNSLDIFPYKFCDDPRSAAENPETCDFSQEPKKSHAKQRNDVRKELSIKMHELENLKNTNNFLRGSDILRVELNNELIAKLESLKNEAFRKYKDAESDLNANFDFKGKALGNSYMAFLLGGVTQQTIANAMKFVEIKPLKIQTLSDIKEIDILNEIPFKIDKGFYDVATPLNKDYASVGLIRASLMATKSKSNNPNVKILVFSSAASDNDYALFKAGLCQRLKNGIKQITGKNAEIYAITLGLSKDEGRIINESKYKEVWSQCTNNILIGNTVDELMYEINSSVFNNPYGNIIYK